MIQSGRITELVCIVSDLRTSLIEMALGNEYGSTYAIERFSSEDSITKDNKKKIFCKIL